jgi:hypothetical protein
MRDGRSVFRTVWCAAAAVLLPAAAGVAVGSVSAASGVAVSLGVTGSNVARGVGGSTVLDQASGMVPSRFDPSAFIVANQYNMVRFRPRPSGSSALVEQTVLFRGGYSQLEAVARGAAPGSGLPDRVLAFQASEWGATARVVVFREAVSSGVLQREAEFGVVQASGAPMPNVEAVVYEPVSRRAWLFTKDSHPTRIFYVNFAANPSGGVFRASSWVGEWFWEAGVPVDGSACAVRAPVKLVPTDAFVDPVDHRTVFFVSNQLFRERVAAELMVVRRPSGGDWRNVGAFPSWVLSRVQMGNGRHPCYPNDVAGLGAEALAVRPYSLPRSGVVRQVELFLVQDNNRVNRVASRLVSVRVP